LLIILYLTVIDGALVMDIASIIKRWSHRSL